ncbi:MAG TPA: hypothetical protein VIL55_01870, partial [Naasia sp.]
AHNHGFAVRAPLDAPVDTPFGRAEVSHVGLNDDVVEGIACLDIPAFSVQYHPEAAAGPHDSSYLFDRFREMVLASRSSAADAIEVEAEPRVTQDDRSPSSGAAHAGIRPDDTTKEA